MNVKDKVFWLLITVWVVCGVVAVVIRKDDPLTYAVTATIAIGVGWIILH